MILKKQAHADFRAALLAFNPWWARQSSPAHVAKATTFMDDSAAAYVAGDYARSRLYVAAAANLMKAN